MPNIFDSVEFAPLPFIPLSDLIIVAEDFGLPSVGYILASTSGRYYREVIE